uniref:Uncharacterized protein n=1 Tax=Tanacetum cinerariifolium TaxID=118510 RepID=A0A699TY16_TANCI|nr:hypothetical protein [Tanacetum cinerariifolium]
MKRARTTYQDENKITSFVQEEAWEILRSLAKWDAPSPVELVDLTKGEQVLGVAHAELFGEIHDHVPRAPTKPPVSPKKRIQDHDEHQGK